MRVFIIAILAFFFSLGFSQEPELADPQTQSDAFPEFAPEAPETDSASAFTEPLSEPAAFAQEPEPVDESYKDAAKVASSGSSSEPLMGWRGWTRLAAFTLAVVSGVGAAFKNSDAAYYKDNINTLKDDARAGEIYDGGSNADEQKRNRWKNLYNEQKNELEKNELYRNIFGISAGVFATAGIVTFFF